jgi:hypothetical protein
MERAAKVERVVKVVKVNRKPGKGRLREARDTAPVPKVAKVVGRNRTTVPKVAKVVGMNQTTVPKVAKVVGVLLLKEGRVCLHPKAEHQSGGRYPLMLNSFNVLVSPYCTACF